MGTQSLTTITRESRRKSYEDKMIKEGEDHLLYTYYHLGNPTNIPKLLHLDGLYTAYSNPYCNVINFIEKQFKIKHDYLNVENTTMCEKFDICYNK